MVTIFEVQKQKLHGLFICLNKQPFVLGQNFYNFLSIVNYDIKHCIIYVCNFDNFDFRRLLATPSYVIIEMAPIFFGKLQVYIDTLELKFCKNL